MVVEEEEIENEIGDGVSIIPENMKRKQPPALPELSQTRTIRLWTGCLEGRLLRAG